MFFYEQYRFGEDGAFNIFTKDNFTFPIHLHRSFEFIYVYDGQVETQIDNDTLTLTPGEMLLIFPNQLHAYSTLGSSKILICIFSPEHINLFYQLSLNKKQEHIVTKLDKKTEDFILEKLPLCGSNRFLIKACFYAICSDIFEKTRLTDKGLESDIALQHKILAFIEENYKEDISMKDISKKLGYNYQYLSRFFNAQFKISFSHMLNERRINYAAYLLKNSEKSITDIAMNCGFKSIRSFNRNFFMVMKKTPSQYKKL